MFELKSLVFYSKSAGEIITINVSSLKLLCNK
ncbi:uncharacterized protein METZ01_LOCUS122266, partial [marine metagenome]